MLSSVDIKDFFSQNDVSDFTETGTVITVADGIIQIVGLNKLKSG